MSEATVIDNKGDEYVVEYKWIEETNTTLKFMTDKHTYTGFSKYNIVVWFTDGEQKNE